MSVNDVIHKCTLKSKATSKIKMQQILSYLTLNDVGIYLRGGPFESGIGIVNLHPFQCTHWVLCYHDCYIDSYGITLPNKLFFIETKCTLFIFGK